MGTHITCYTDGVFTSNLNSNGLTGGMSAQSGMPLVLVHTHSQWSLLNQMGAPPYLMGDKETVSRGWNLARTRNPHKRTSRAQHNGSSSGERCQLPKVRYYALHEPKLGGNKHVGAAILTTRRTDIETIQQIRGE